MVTVHLMLTDLDDAAEVGRLDDDLSAVSGAALVVVHADGADASAVARVVTATRATPCVLVAEAGDADALADVVDAVVADDDELDAMVAQVARTPLAAVRSFCCCGAGPPERSPKGWWPSRPRTRCCRVVPSSPRGVRGGRCAPAPSRPRTRW